MSLLTHVSPETRRHDLRAPFALECGARLGGVRVAYRTWGDLADDGGNAVVVCHALTGSADVDRWWPALLGDGRAFDPRRDFIVSSNVLGGCYGTTGPTSLRPGTDRRYGPEFPPVTVRDMVRLQMALLDHLGVRRIKLVIGGSLGAMQVLEWALLDPGRVEAIAPIAVGGRHSAWCIGISEAQRQAIYADGLWQGGRYEPMRPPDAGLAAARAIAMTSYRSRASFERRFARARRLAGEFTVEAYLRHHGEKLVERFDANTYVGLTRTMDSHDVARDRGTYEDVLRSIRQPALVVGVDSDVLYPVVEQVELAALLPNATFHELHSDNGHDAFLVDAADLEPVVRRFRATPQVNAAYASPAAVMRPHEGSRTHHGGVAKRAASGTAAVARLASPHR